MSFSGVSCLVVPRVIPGTLTEVQKYSTLGSFIMLNIKLLVLE